MAEFTMPSLGADMDEGTVVEWLVKPGDEVHKGDIVAVVDTAKSAVEVECFVSGTIKEIVVSVGQSVPVGTVLAHITPIGAPAEAPGVPPPPAGVPAVPTPSPAIPAAEVPHVDSPIVRRLAAQLHVDLSAIKGTGPAGRITRADVERAASPPRRQPASPQARRLAKELSVDITTVVGTGPDGAVRADDVRAAASRIPAPERAAPERAAPERLPTPTAAERMTAMRQAIAALMARSKREIPHYYLSTTVDMTNATNWLREHNRDLPIAQRLVPAALVLKAVAIAVGKVPDLNGFWIDDRFVAGEAAHLGVAISLRGGGLVAPAIHNAGDLSVDDLMAALRDLVARARSGRLRSSEMSDPTITITNLGEQGVEAVLGVIYPPQVALVGFGKVVQRPFAVDELLGVRPVASLTLSGDHRATDGFTGARFLDTIDKLLQKPEEL